MSCHCFANTDFIIKADLVFLAMGFMHPIHEGLINSLRLKLDKRGNVFASDKDYKTSIPQIYAAGDIRRGQSLVVWAIREGRLAANSIHNDLKSKKDYKDNT